MRFNSGVAILGAGRSRRMGEPKLLLPWGRTSVLGHLIQTWTKLGVGQIAVVCASNAPEINAELDRLEFARQDRIANPSPDSGMFGSIQCAARWRFWRSDLTHFAITLGDQPHLRQKTLEHLLEFAGAHPGKICQPLRCGRRRHPVIIPREAFATLSVFAGSDLKQFLNAAPELLAGCETDDPGLDLDMDSPSDYARLRVLADSP